ncbi:hypothetical protein D3C81_1777850 [compost metagenome]
MPLETIHRAQLNAQTGALAVSSMKVAHGLRLLAPAPKMLTHLTLLTTIEGEHGHLPGLSIFLGVLCGPALELTQLVNYRSRLSAVAIGLAIETALYIQPDGAMRVALEVPGALVRHVLRTGQRLTLIDMLA